MSQGLGMVEKSVRTMLRNKRAGRVTWNTRREADSTKLSGKRPSRLSQMPSTSTRQMGPVMEREKCRLANRSMMRVLCNGEESRLGKGILTPWACIHRS